MRSDQPRQCARACQKAACAFGFNYGGPSDVRSVFPTSFTFCQRTIRQSNSSAKTGVFDVLYRSPTRRHSEKTVRKYEKNRRKYFVFQVIRAKRKCKISGEKCEKPTFESSDAGPFAQFARRSKKTSRFRCRRNHLGPMYFACVCFESHVNAPHTERLPVLAAPQLKKLLPVRRKSSPTPPSPPATVAVGS